MQITIKIAMAIQMVAKRVPNRALLNNVRTPLLLVAGVNSAPDLPKSTDKSLPLTSCLTRYVTSWLTVPGPISAGRRLAKIV